MESSEDAIVEKSGKSTRYVATVGDRVVAVRDTDERTVRMFGFGQYVGDEIPTKTAALRGDFALMLRALDKANPKVVLDDGGGDVFGCECWWGPESGFKAFVGDREVEIVPLDPPNQALLEVLDA